MKTQYLPGPWAFGQDMGYCQVVHQVDGPAIATVLQCWNTTHEQAVANSHLIAAAPELLDLLRRVLPYVSMGWEADDCDVYGVHGNDVGGWQQEAEAAIAKAAGGAA